MHHELHTLQEVDDGVLSEQQGRIYRHHVVELLPICRRGSRCRLVGSGRRVRLAALEFQLLIVRIDRNYVYVSGAIGDKVEVIAVFDARRPFREADYASLQTVLAIIAVLARGAVITFRALLSRYAYRSCLLDLLHPSLCRASSTDIHPKRATAGCHSSLRGCDPF